METQEIRDAHSEAVDRILSGMNQWTPEERSRYCDEEVMLHPLFMSKSPSFEEVNKNPSLQAIMNIEYDEDETPERLAREAKEKGNISFQNGPEFYGNAIRHYNEAIDHSLKVRTKNKQIKQEMQILQSSCFSNLAAVYLHRKKYITVIDMCLQALKANSKNSKAFYRIIKAYLALGNASKATEYLNLSLELDPSNDSFLKLQKEIRELMSVQEKNKLLVEEAEYGREKALQLVRSTCIERNIRIGRCLISELSPDDFFPTVEIDREDDSKTMFWPVIIKYLEYGHYDVLQSVSEMASMHDIIETMFPNPQQFAPWDIKKQYSLPNLLIFYQTHSTTPLKDINLAWRRDQNQLESDSNESISYRQEFVSIPLAAPLLYVLMQQNHIVADIPVFYVVPRNSEYFKRMIQSAGGKLQELKVPESVVAP
jgi:tetratricopeptide (TPR) repeat protein